MFDKNNLFIFIFMSYKFIFTEKYKFMLSRTRKVMFLSRKASLLGPDFRSFCRPKQNYLSIQRENTYFTREICVFYESTRKTTKCTGLSIFPACLFRWFRGKRWKTPSFLENVPDFEILPQFRGRRGFCPIRTFQTLEFRVSRVATRESEKPLPRFLKVLRRKSGAQISEKWGFSLGKRVSDPKSIVLNPGTQKSCFLRLTSKNGSLFVCFGINPY